MKNLLKAVSMILFCFGVVWGCQQGNRSDDKDWSKGARAPDRFILWRGLSSGINLPASRDDLTKFIGEVGGEYYITGEGSAKIMEAPPPQKRSICLGSATKKAIIFYFSADANGTTPRYIAYLTESGMAICIDSQFSYLAI